MRITLSDRKNLWRMKRIERLYKATSASSLVELLSVRVGLVKVDAQIKDDLAWTDSFGFRDLAEHQRLANIKSGRAELTRLEAQVVPAQKRHLMNDKVHSIMRERRRTMSHSVEAKELEASINELICLRLPSNK